ncbi:Uncharacterised protein [Mycobacterium tuberculosis]|nr:Uncharacterised protein [Mycobacterium tuberculosis]
MSVNQRDRISGEAADRRQWQRDVELQRRAVHTEHLGQRFTGAPQPLLRSGIHTDRGLPAHPCTAEQVGEPVGLIVVGGQFHQ